MEAEWPGNVRRLFMRANEACLSYRSVDESDERQRQEIERYLGELPPPSPSTPIAIAVAIIWMGFLCAYNLHRADAALIKISLCLYKSTAFDCLAKIV